MQMHDGLQRQVREAITRADDLSRRAHEARLDPLAGRLDALRTVLDDIDEGVGAPSRSAPWLDYVVETRGILEELASFSAIMAPELRGALDDFLLAARALPYAIDRFVAKLKSPRIHARIAIVAGALIAVGIAGGLLVRARQR